MPPAAASVAVKGRVAVHGPERCRGRNDYARTHSDGEWFGARGGAQRIGRGRRECVGSRLRDGGRGAAERGAILREPGGPIAERPGDGARSAGHGKSLRIGRCRSRRG